jgi:hypothetical protein
VRLRSVDREAAYRAALAQIAAACRAAPTDAHWGLSRAEIAGIAERALDLRLPPFGTLQSGRDSSSVLDSTNE